MKKLLYLFFFIFFLTDQLVANEREKELNVLFNKLQDTNSKFTYEIEQKIWKIWSTHPKNNELTLMLLKGSKLVDNQKLNEAVKLFSKIIKIDPYWAEAWNKRATVFFLLGEFQKSQNDIDKVLKLEKGILEHLLDKDLLTFI